MSFCGHNVEIEGLAYSEYNLEVAEMRMLRWICRVRKLDNIVRVAMNFRSTFVESCNQIHFWKAQTSLKPKTNVSI